MPESQNGNDNIVQRKSRRYESRKKIRTTTRRREPKPNKTLQRTKSICIQRFGIVADARYTVRQNVLRLATNTHPLDLPRRPNNLKVHNLCREPEKISKELLDTLGLNLGFGIALPPKKDKIPIDFERIRRDIRIKFIEFPDDSNNNTFNKKLHVKKDNPNMAKAPREIERAINNFEQATREAFNNSWKRPFVGNLEKKKIEMLRQIRKERKYIIVAADKNLGPCIIELEQYINKCMTVHLNATGTYKELIEMDARIMNEENFRWVCKEFIDNRKSKLTKQDRKFFIESIHGKRDGLNRMHPDEKLDLPYFYAMPKMHKDPPGLRPVVSGVSTVMESLSKWLDVQLQSVVHLCPCYLKDSWHFLNDIKNLKELQGCKLVTSDADAFYTNINTNHAIEIMEKWCDLHRNDIPEDFPRELVLKGIKRLMENNVFTFGDRFFLQLNGTAMGTNVACMYATIYYSYHEETQLIHLPFIKFYRRLIDDAFIIFDDTKGTFQELKNNMNDFGPTEKRLNWSTEEPADEINFLDLTIKIQNDGTITTKTFQKAMNLYLYRTPDSCQPGNILYSFVYGLIHRYYWQNSNERDFLHVVEALLQRMLERGHILNNINKIFINAVKKVKTSSMPNPRPGTPTEQTETKRGHILNNINKIFINAVKKVKTSSMPNPRPGTPTEQTETNRNLLFIHLPHHPNNPTKDDLKILTTNLQNEMKELGLKLERVIIAHSKAPNIGDICKKHRLEGFIDTRYIKQQEL